MTKRLRLPVAMAAIAAAASTLVAPSTADAGPRPVLGAGAPPAVTARFDGSKAASGGTTGPARNAVGDVTIQSQGCSPNPVAFGGQTTCTYAVQNQTTTSTTVDLQASGDDELAVVGADKGAVTNDGTARAEDVALPGRSTSPIQVNPGNTFAGYYPLESIPINPQTISDDQILNYTVQPYRWNGATYTSIGVSANGYAIVGGADTSKDASATPQDLPNPGRPNNVLAPFWTDLTPAGGGTLRVATVANTAQPPCERSYWFVAQWDMFEYGTTTRRKAQLWIQADDPDCATDPVPAERIYFTYDPASMTVAPARPFRIGAENSSGTVGGMRPAGELPAQDYVVTSSGTTQPAPVVTWKVVGQGKAAGTGTVAATVESSLIPGSSTVFTDATVSAQATPTITDQPDDTTVTAGQQAVFSASATGAASVRWQVSTDGGMGWADVSGATATTLAFTAHGDDDGNQYRAVFANSSGGETTTDAATLTVDRIATVTSVTSSPSAPDVGESTTFTATLTPAAATGTVQFTVDGADLGGPVAVSGGTATSPATTSLAAGDHSIVATYSGDTDHAGSSGTATVSVGKVASSTSVTVAPSAPKVGEDVSFDATVAPSGASGTVQFKVDGSNLGSPVTVVNGQASSVDLTGLARGTHVVEAAYSGDSTYAASTSGPVTFTVARRTTTTTVAVQPANPDRSDDVSFTATVDPTPGGGTVQFTVDGSAYGSPVAVADGTATSSSTDALAAGDHTVSASYSGDDGYAPSSSSTTNFSVGKRDSSTTVLEVRPAVLSAGEDGAVDVSVSPVPTGGSVQLSLDGTDVGSALTLDGEGKATGTLADLPAGDHSLVATFSGDDDLLSSSDTEPLRVYSPQEAFVRRAYLAVLGRPGDDGGVAFQVQRLGSGVSPERVAWDLAGSAEARRRLADATYLRALSRPADPDGRTYWATELGKGVSAEDFLATLIASPEGYQRSGHDPEGTALTLFHVHLQRDPGTSELAYWRGRVAAANDRIGRKRTALTFGRVPEATRVATGVAVDVACPTPPSSNGTVAARWAPSGRNPLRLIGSALALGCPPEGLGTTSP